MLELMIITACPSNSTPLLNFLILGKRQQLVFTLAYFPIIACQLCLHGYHRPSGEGAAWQFHNLYYNNKQQDTFYQDLEVKQDTEHNALPLWLQLGSAVSYVSSEIPAESQ